MERFGHERRQPVIKSQQANSVYNDGRGSVRYEIIFKVWYSLPIRPYQGRERETDRQRETERDRETDRDTDKDSRQTERGRQTDTENEDRQREAER